MPDQNDQNTEEYTSHSIGDHSLHVSSDSNEAFRNVFNKLDREKQESLLKEAKSRPSHGSEIKDPRGNKYVVKPRPSGGFTLEKKKSTGGWF